MQVFQNNSQIRSLFFCPYFITVAFAIYTSAPVEEVPPGSVQQNAMRSRMSVASDSIAQTYPGQIVAMCLPLEQHIVVDSRECATSATIVAVFIDWVFFIYWGSEVGFSSWALLREGKGRRKRRKIVPVLGCVGTKFASP